MPRVLGLARIGQAAALATHEDVAAGVQLRHPPSAALTISGILSAQEPRTSAAEMAPRPRERPAIVVLYELVRRRFGTGAGLLAALFLALNPISVAVDRSNSTKSWLVLTVLLAAGALSRAVEPAGSPAATICGRFAPRSADAARKRSSRTAGTKLLPRRPVLCTNAGRMVRT